MKNPISVTEAADLLGCKTDWIRKLAKRELIIGIKSGHIWIIDRDSVLKYKDTERKTGPKGRPPKAADD